MCVYVFVCLYARVLHVCAYYQNNQPQGKRVRVNVCRYVCVYVYVCVCVRVRACAYVCMCVRAHTGDNGRGETRSRTSLSSTVMGSPHTLDIATFTYTLPTYPVWGLA